MSDWIEVKPWEAMKLVSEGWECEFFTGEQWLPKHKPDDLHQSYWIDSKYRVKKPEKTEAEAFLEKYPVGTWIISSEEGSRPVEIIGVPVGLNKSQFIAGRYEDGKVSTSVNPRYEHWKLYKEPSEMEAEGGCEASLNTFGDEIESDPHILHKIEMIELLDSQIVELRELRDRQQQDKEMG